MDIKFSPKINSIYSLYQKDGGAAFKHIQQKIDWTMDSSVLYSIIED